MKYTIERYNSFKDVFGCRDEDGKFWELDLFTDASFPDGYRKFDTKEELDEYYRSLVGRTLEIESLSPYIPCYFASNIKFIDAI